MENLNKIPSSGTYGSIVSVLDTNFQRIKTKMDELEHVCLEGFCGVFSTVAGLRAAYPNPEDGKIAYVGSSAPLAIYKSDSGDWVDSGGTYGSIDLSSKADTSALNNLSSLFTAFKNASYVYGGQAKPNTSPSYPIGITIDKWFYFAWTAGTYTNYGGGVLAEGQIAVITQNGSTWNMYKHTVVADSIVGGYDVAPIEDGEKPITSGGVYAALEALKEDIEEELSGNSPTFSTGEQVGDVAIISSFGDNANALPTQEAVLNAITTVQMDAMNSDRNILCLGYKPSRYVVTKNYVKVGVVDVISDPMNGYLTQVFTTRFTEAGLGSYTSYSETETYQYYRMCKVSGVGEGVWSAWKRVNSDAWASYTASALVSYYTKSEVYNKQETYSKTEVNNLIGRIHSFDVVVRNTLPTADETTLNKLYLIPASYQPSGNYNDEYITVEENNRYRWELIGSTAINMSLYPTKVEMASAINTSLASYYTKTQVDTMLDEKQDVIDDLASIRSGAAAGATAVQPAAIADFATVSYVDNSIDGGYALS